MSYGLDLTEDGSMNDLSDLIIIHTTGLEESIRCALCKNPMKTDRGCDGLCSVDENDVQKVLDVIDSMRVKGDCPC